MGFNPITKNGYSMFELSSALQKDIRRGNERNALYWAYELNISNYGGYLWKRLTIISIEDIGPADVSAVTFIHSLKSAYEELKKKKSPDTDLTIAAAVLYLSRSDKSRIFDWAKCWMIHSHPRHRPEIPEYALDMHTHRGKSKGKGVEDFFKDGCIVAPHIKFEGEQEYKADFQQLLKLNETSPIQPPSRPKDPQIELF